MAAELTRVRTVDSCQSVFVNVQMFVLFLVAPSELCTCGGIRLNCSSRCLQQLV